MEAGSSSADERRERLARFLRQRVELGGGELFLEKLSGSALRAAVEAFLEAAEGSASAAAAPGPAPPPAAAPAPGAPPTSPPAASSPGTTSTPAAAASSGHAAAPAAGAAASSGRAAAPAPPATPESNPASPAARESEDAAPAAPGTAAALELPDRHDALRELALVCERCSLAEGRTNVVFGDGNPDARLVVVGEAPGANEDRTGLPFVGQAGRLLDLLLASVGLSRRDSVYICNVIKCRPPGNRNPRPDEIEACAPFLHRQIEIVAPEAILAVGTFAAQLLTGEKVSLGKLRGRRFLYRDVPLIVTYHPAALLRNPGWTRPTWDDLQLLRRILDGD